MTYSGQLMLDRLHRRRRACCSERTIALWTALVMPALIAALAATLSRNAWVGACVGIGLLFLIRDFRLFALLPVVAALFIAVRPGADDRSPVFVVPHRKHLRHDTAATEASLLSNRDRLAMIRSGLRIIKDDPLTGVGPDMVIKVYPYYRDPNAVQQLNSHLHNVPLQIAAERGLPALAALAVVHRHAAPRLRDETAPATCPSLNNGALASTVAMLDRRHVRVQLRRLRVPDALPRAGDASLCRRSQHGGDAAAGMTTAAAGSPLAPVRRTRPRRRRSDARSFRDRKRAIGFRRKLRSRSFASTTRAIGSVAPPTSPTTCGARAHAWMSSVSSATDDAAASCARSSDDSASAPRRSSRIRTPDDA